jgi:hypothetical protein
VRFFLEDRVLLSIMFGLLLFYGWVANMVGSHLLGAFIAGVSFCWMKEHAGLILWHSQVRHPSFATALSLSLTLILTTHLLLTLTLTWRLLRAQVKRIANWLIRLFFGATVAFSIPIQMMLNPEALWRGVLLGLGPCIATKIVAGPKR